MQQADIKTAFNGRGVFEGQILFDGRRREALPMDGHVHFSDLQGCRFFSRKQMHVIRKAQIFGNFAGGVVIAGHDVHGDSGIAQPAGLGHEIKARIVIPPIAVIKVPGNQNKCDLFVNRRLDQIVEGPAGSPAQLIDRGALVGLEPVKGAVKVDVGRVDEFKHNCLTRTSRLERSGNPDLSGNRKGLSQRRKDAKINFMICLCGLCGFAR